jgi:hypothetical protein
MGDFIDELNRLAQAVSASMRLRKVVGELLALASRRREASKETLYRIAGVTCGELSRCCSRPQPWPTRLALLSLAKWNSKTFEGRLPLPAMASKTTPTPIVNAGHDMTRTEDQQERGPSLRLVDRQQ